METKVFRRAEYPALSEELLNDSEALLFLRILPDSHDLRREPTGGEHHQEKAPGFQDTTDFSENLCRLDQVFHGDDIQHDIE